MVGRPKGVLRFLDRWVGGEALQRAPDTLADSWHRTLALPSELGHRAGNSSSAMQRETARERRALVLRSTETGQVVGSGPKALEQHLVWLGLPGEVTAQAWSRQTACCLVFHESFLVVLVWETAGFRSWCQADSTYLPGHMECIVAGRTLGVGRKS